MALIVDVHDEGWLDAGRHAWDALLAASAIDPLYNGAAWQSLWWRTHGRSLRGALHIYVVREGNEVVAVLPTYRRTVRLYSLIAVTRIEVIGSTLRDGGGVFSEYLDAAVLPGFEAQAAIALAEHIRGRRDWGEFACANVCIDSWLLTELVPRLGGSDAYVRAFEATNAWGIALEPGAAHWRAQLPGAVRRKVFGLRKRLIDPQLRVLGASDLPEVFALLDRFHEARWGRPHFVGEVVSFYRQLIEAQPSMARPSLLLHDGWPVSALFDLVLGERQYNVQSGFAADAIPGVSLGYLHLGYAIEAAADLGITHYDLLGGGGKQRDYKRDLASPTSVMVTMQVIRSAALAGMYRWWDARNAAGELPTVEGGGD